MNKDETADENTVANTRPPKRNMNMRKQIDKENRRNKETKKNTTEEDVKHKVLSFSLPSRVS